MALAAVCTMVALSSLFQGRALSLKGPPDDGLLLRVEDDSLQHKQSKQQKSQLQQDVDPDLKRPVPDITAYTLPPKVSPDLLEKVPKDFGAQKPDAKAVAAAAADAQQQKELQQQLQRQKEEKEQQLREAKEREQRDRERQEQQQREQEERLQREKEEQQRHEQQEREQAEQKARAEEEARQREQQERERKEREEREQKEREERERDEREQRERQEQEEREQHEREQRESEQQQQQQGEEEEQQQQPAAQAERQTPEQVRQLLQQRAQTLRERALQRQQEWAAEGGVRPGQLQCDVHQGEARDNIKNIAYWKHVADDIDGHPKLKEIWALGPEEKYVTFEMDWGGWNNIRMGAETVVAFASMTGRTLVLPPLHGLYLQHHGDPLGLSDYYTPDFLAFPDRVKIITTREYLALKDADNGGLGVMPDKPTAEMSHDEIYRFYAKVAEQYVVGVPEMDPGHTAFVFPDRAGEAIDASDPRGCITLYIEDNNTHPGKNLTSDAATGSFATSDYADNKDLQDWLAGRELLEYDKVWQDTPVIHWSNPKTRLLTIFHTFMYHMDPSVNRYHMRLIRDMMHYRDEVFCKASQVIALVNADAGPRGWSSFHLRLGDFQFEESTKIPMPQIVADAAEYLEPRELLYIATDEKDRGVFEPFRSSGHDVRFLDDYWARAGLDELSNGNFVGMVESAVAAHGRVFTGSWWSTFTAHIVRFRGYIGRPHEAAYYTYRDRRKFLHGYRPPESPYWISEWYQGWEGIDEASGGTMQCDVHQGDGAHSIENIAYWKKLPKDEHGHPKLKEIKALGGPREQYVTFEMDWGGWNNIRMGVETVVAFASMTGRTLVLPPVHGLYLQNGGEPLALTDYYSPDLINYPNRLATVTTHEYLARMDADNGGLGVMPDKPTAEMDHDDIYKFYEKVAGQYAAGLPELNCGQTAIVFPDKAGEVIDMGDPRYSGNKDFTDWLAEREIIQYDSRWQEARVIHWSNARTRLLTIYHTFLYHMDPSVNRYQMRLIRDMMHYRDEVFCKASQPMRYRKEVFCKASQVVTQVKRDAGAGGWSSFHLRLGDFQFEASTKIPMGDIAGDAEEYLQPREMVYIATDERNKTLFEPFWERHTVRFLDDYWKSAGLDELSNGNFVGMVESVVAAYGRTFTGSWWSTFSAHIQRLHGYLGFPRDSVWYTYRERRKFAHADKPPESPYWISATHATTIAMSSAQFTQCCKAITIRTIATLRSVGAHCGACLIVVAFVVAAEWYQGWEDIDEASPSR
ncbi:hypothetical protein JKP88DRAFT_326219 [Tribonema minus]|uniref:Beta-N-acetylhexosaminidase n=1 Tax=Tribonema minus TaxID=303371 RepID=A0A836CC39_9STRA|nr:hypothetical protein JKP88DRAFT_326219 [Tribonema minus]